MGQSLYPGANAHGRFAHLDLLGKPNDMLDSSLNWWDLFLLTPRLGSQQYTNCADKILEWVYFQPRRLEFISASHSLSIPANFRATSG